MMALGAGVVGVGAGRESGAAEAAMSEGDGGAPRAQATWAKALKTAYSTQDMRREMRMEILCKDSLTNH